MVMMASAGSKARRNTSSYGRLDFSGKREERDDAPEYSDNEGSNYHYDREALSPRSNGDTTIGKRRLKDATIITDVSSTVAPHEWRKDRYEASSQQLSKAAQSRRSKAASAKIDDTFIACSSSKAAAQNDIINLGKEFELGFKSFNRRLKNSTSNTTITDSQSSHHTNESPSANSLLDKITGAPKRSDMSLGSDNKYNNSSTSVITGGGCSRKSSKHMSKTNTNHHSFKMEQSSTQRKQLKYWSGLSVRVAMAVIQANGSKKMAQKASSIVIVEGRKQNGRDRNSNMMRALSAKLSVAMLEAGADRKISLAIMNAITTYDNNNVVKSAESMSFDGSSTTKTSRNIKGDLIEETRSVAPSVASSRDPTIRSNRSKAVSITPSNRSKAASITPALSSTRSKLQTIEMQILEKQRAIEEAELRNQEKEREFNERMAALKAAADERLAALDATKDSLLEKEESTQSEQLDTQANIYESTGNCTKQENTDNEIVSSFQSGIDDFVLSFNEQMTALETAAKEGLAGLDATKTSLLEKASFTQSDQVDIVAEDIGNAGKDLKEENDDNGTASAFQSGIAGFVLGIKEKLADLDAATTVLLENAGILENAGSFVGTTTAEQQNVTAEKSRNIDEDFKQEDNDNEATNALQLFGNRLLQSFDCSEGKAQQELPKMNSPFMSGIDEDDLGSLWEV